MWVTASVLGAIALGLMIGLWIVGAFNKVMLVCALVAGFSLAYPIAEYGGPALSQLDQVAAWVSINLVLASIASVIVFYDFKSKSIKKWHILLAFATPTLFLLAAGPFLMPLNLVGGIAPGLDAALSQMGR